MASYVHFKFDDESLKAKTALKSNTTYGFLVVDSCCASWFVVWMLWFKQQYVFLDSELCVLSMCDLSFPFPEPEDPKEMDKPAAVKKGLQQWLLQLFYLFLRSNE